MIQEIKENYSETEKVQWQEKGTMNRSKKMKIAARKIEKRLRKEKWLPELDELWYHVDVQV